MSAGDNKKQVQLLTTNWQFIRESWKVVFYTR